VSIEPFRFLHTGDLHLDSRVKGLSVEAPPEVLSFTCHPWIGELLDAGGERTISLG
jgi:hypothetical protein